MTFASGSATMQEDTTVLSLELNIARHCKQHMKEMKSYSRICLYSFLLANKGFTELLAVITIGIGSPVHGSRKQLVHCGKIKASLRHQTGVPKTLEIEAATTTQDTRTVRCPTKRQNV